MEYIVISSSKCDYQKWQLELLAWSAKKVKQTGKIIVLLSHDHNHQSENTLIEIPDVEIITLPDWAKEWEVENDDWWGGIPNKYEAVKWLTQNKKLNPSDRLLFLDPDMIFTKPVDIQPGIDEVVGQKWQGFDPLPEYPSSYNDSIMYPFVVRFSTLCKIADSYKEYCTEIRKKTARWEAEMWGLHYAFESNRIKITPVEDLGRCTLWNGNRTDNTSDIIHFPNPIVTAENEKIFFKQDYTVALDQNIEINKARNTTDKQLLTNIDQERTDYIYDAKWNFDNIFRFYDGSKGYIYLDPYPGGFNNIRMSLELAVCISYELNRTLVLPPGYGMYLLKGTSNLTDFFNTDTLGIKHLTLQEFSKLKEIENTPQAVKDISKVIDKDTIPGVINFEKIKVPGKFLKNREEILSESVIDDSEILYFEKKLLGNFYQSIYSKFDTNYKKLIAKYVTYRNDIRDIAWRFIQLLGDRTYYSVHIRRNDFQYKELHLPPEEVLKNIIPLVPEGSTLYIATDHQDNSFFNIFKEKYKVVFYKELVEQLSEDIHINWIPIIEQLICTRSIKFIGNKQSTLSSFIFRMRGYMDDIEDKNYYLNSEDLSYSPDLVFYLDDKYIANWAREYSDGWCFDNSKIFVSIASYLDSQIIDTVKSVYEESSDPNRLTVVVHLQDTEERYFELQNLNFPNLKIIFTPYYKTKGVVWARERIKEQLQDEPYFLQIDSHSRVKQNWDLILINQYNSIESPKVILTTYPNEFTIPDPDKNYLNLPYNAPIKFKRFLEPGSDIDNKFIADNLPSLQDYEVVESKKIGAGFIFTRTEWIREVKSPENIIFSGEEDALTYLSYLKGWNILTPSEATVWHNYDFKTSDKTAYRKHNNQYHLEDKSTEEINNILFNNTYERSLSELESFLGAKFRKPDATTNKTIFIALTSFLDKDLRNTILSCINQAKNPQNLSFGVILQYNHEPGSHEGCIDDLVEKYNIRIKKYNYKDSRGGCWARNLVADLYQNEDYSLQIDSHIRLCKHWDYELIVQHSSINNKCILSYLSPSFTYNSELGLDTNFIHTDNLELLNIPKIEKITDEYFPVFQGYTNEVKTNGLNRKVSLLYCGFIFGEGKWIIDIKNDPEHYYTGEEFALSIRAFTKGYDIFQPSRIVSWHRANPDHIHHHSIFDDSNERHKIAMERLRKLIFKEDLGEYGLGSERSLEDYENFANINIKEKRVYS